MECRTAVVVVVAAALKVDGVGMERRPVKDHQRGAGIVVHTHH